MIRTRIVWVEGSYADHVNTTSSNLINAIRLLVSILGIVQIVKNNHKTTLETYDWLALNRVGTERVLALELWYW